jgi:activator of HSP90 ATPase
MAKEKLSMSVLLPAAPEKIYAAWLNAKEHSKFTGARATTSKRIGSRFTAWDGYISGKTLALETNRGILQSWRTTEFADTDPDSLLEVSLAPAKGGTRLTLKHTGLPRGGAKQYRAGWKEFYFEPMKAYFSG